MQYRLWMSIGLMLVSISVLLAQGDTPTIPTDVNCSPSALSELSQSLDEDLRATDSAETDPTAVRANLFQLGALYQTLALQCGYTPTPEEVTAEIERTLTLTDVARIIQVSAVGMDTDLILAELETVNGDSFNGSLLYNSLELALDGTALGCASCHAGVAAPATEGTYTRIERRLQTPEFADYSIDRYLVESIIHPNDYLVPGYEPIMSPNYGLRLNILQLADLIAFLKSQDQLLDDADSQ